MRILIAAVGRLKGGPEKALFDDYAGRLAWPVTVREVEAQSALPATEIKVREGALLLAALEGKSKAGKSGARPRRRLVALDERGAEPTSIAFAERLGAWRDQGAEEIAFVIGGADGLDEAVRARADWVVAFGRLTWPHLLVRALLAEQLYRAQQILAGHPYHRA
jgi:23S rRNA (pseudouridine1915-N3)-methyltransferase